MIFWASQHSIRRTTSPKGRRTARFALQATLFAAIVGIVSMAGGQSGPVYSDVDRLIHESASGIVLPTVPLPADLEVRHADRAQSWSSGDHQRVLLEGNVRMAIGSYGFRADRAVLFIRPVSRPGRTVYDLAIYLDHVRELGNSGPVTAEANRLLVTAMIDGDIRLSTSLLNRQPADDDPLVQAAVARVHRYEQALAANMVDAPPPTTAEPPVAERATVPGPPPTAEPAAPSPAAPGQPEPTAPIVQAEPAPAREPGAPAMPTPPAEPALPGQINFSFDRAVYQDAEDAGYAALMGQVTVLYHDPAQHRTISLRAENVVVFTEPHLFDQAVPNSAPADAIRGVYLEEGVIISDGEYTLRAPRAYYDLQTDRAVLLDAVFFTWDVKRRVPLYVRAKEIRRESRDRFSARQARLTTSEFAEPHFAIGVDSLTIEQRADSQGDSTTHFTARDTTLRFNGMPLFYWPKISGDASGPPLRHAGLSYDDHDGVVINTEWDLFGLLGTEAPEGVDGTLLVDGYTNRGAGVGVGLDYDVPRAFGEFDGYFLYDTGEDEPPGREEVEPPNETRGKFHWQHRHLLPEDWQLTIEVGYLSDPTFLDEFFREEAYNDKPYETLLYAKKQKDDWAFTFLAKYDLIDFVPQLSQLQSPGYSVEKLPELAYYRLATPVFGEQLTWYSENRASLMRLHLPEPTPDELGFNQAEAVALFGINATQSLDQRFSVDGYDEDERLRFDTRQELQLPLTTGPISIVPFATGRVTFYDDDFDGFSPQLGEEDNLRWWGTIGLRLHTAFSRTYEDVQSSLLDLHRLRHVIEPSITIAHSETNVQQEDLPVYDYDVESLAEGTSVRLGLRNTLQTQRGGPGRWRSVDFLRIDTDFIFHSDETERESPLAQYFDYRPEWSLAGDHFWSEVAWQISDSLSAVGNLNYSFDSSRVEQWNLGLVLDHSPRLNTFIETRYIDSLSSHILRYGINYLLTPKYHVSISQGFDIERSQTRNISVVLTRRLPRWVFMLAIDYDTLGNEQSIGIALAPEGMDNRGAPSAVPFSQR
jgi:lipopolysaccharide assembly outer membrane protein LptD (OstA)